MYIRKPVISIVIPAYNEEQLIAQCLTSLTNQRFDRGFEIIVVNNNSTDKTAEIAESFRVKLVTEKLQGVVSARQKGLEIAGGEIVAGADCDCTYPPDWLNRIYRNFQKDPRIVACGGPGIAQKNPWWAFYIYKIGFSVINIVYRLAGHVLYLPGFNFAFKRQTFLNLGGYRTYLDFGGDELDPLKRLEKTGKVVYDSGLAMHLSTRRYRVGFFQWFFVQNFYYYILNFWLASIFKKTIIKSRPVRNI